jgi:hypothetical protein
MSEAKSREKADDALEGLTMADLRRLADGAGIKAPRSKRALRDAILDRFKGTEVPPEPPTPGASKSLAIRARDAGIPSPDFQSFEGVDSAIGDADRRLKGGESPTSVARFLRERATTVSKANLDEEDRRLKVSQDKDTLRARRKASAEYLRRVATHVQQEGKAAPAKKAPAKKAPGRDLGAELQLLTRGTTVEERPGMRPPAKKAAPTTQAERATRLQVIRGEGKGGGRAVSPPEGSRRLTVVPSGTGTKSTTPEIRNDWGMLGTGGEVEFHDDGVIGQRLRSMGEDRLIDVDGEPLSNVVGKLATRAVRGQISQDQLIDELERLMRRLPEGSKARQGVANMISDLDAPGRATPDIPAGTPAPLRKLMQDLLRIPVARGKVDRPGFHRDQSDSEVDKLLRIMQDFQEGRTGGLRLVSSLLDMRRSLPHESVEGRFEADRAIRQAHEALDKMYRNPETRFQLMPKRS